MMRIEDRFERILKDLDVCTRQVGRGATLHNNLDAKVDAHRLKKILQDVRAKLRIEYFAFEDAVKPIPRLAEKDNCI